MSDTAYLVLKCAIAAAVMAIIHFISKSSNYFLSAIALGFPALSATAYYFMAIERGSADVRTTTFFALFAAIPFLAFLGGTNLALRQYNIAISLAAGIAAWLVLSILLIVLWKHLH
jgi:membrane protein GlpM